MVLGNLIDSGTVPVVRLTEVFRQAAHSRIITTAHRINEGHMPELPAKEAQADFYFIDRAEPEAIAATVLDMVKKRIPARFGLDPIRDIQVLCPMNRGSLGIRELNVRLQTDLNPVRPDEPVVEKFGWQVRPRTKVSQTEASSGCGPGARAVEHLVVRLTNAVAAQDVCAIGNGGVEKQRDGLRPRFAANGETVLANTACVAYDHSGNGPQRDNRENYPAGRGKDRFPGSRRTRRVAAPGSTGQGRRRPC
jgi:hypothetical protein